MCKCTLPTQLALPLNAAQCSIELSKAIYVCIYSPGRHFHLFTKFKRIGGKFFVSFMLLYRLQHWLIFIKTKMLYHSYLLLKGYFQHFSEHYYCKGWEFVLFICLMLFFVCECRKYNIISHILSSDPHRNVHSCK